MRRSFVLRRADQDLDEIADYYAEESGLDLGLMPSDRFLAPPSDAFIAKLSPTGTSLIWATFLGGDGEDVAQTVDVDPVGNVWVSGTTSSSSLPVSSGGQGGAEFLAQLNSSGSALVYSVRLPADSMAAALAVDAAGTVHTAGSTGLVFSFAPATAPAQTSTPRIFGIANAAGGHLAGRIAPSELISIYGVHLGPSVPLTAQFDERGLLPTSLGGVHVMIDGIASPLLYVSGTQINAVTPAKLVSPGAHALQLIANGAYVPVSYSGAAPGSVNGVIQVNFPLLTQQFPN